MELMHGFNDRCRSLSKTRNQVSGIAALSRPLAFGAVYRAGQPINGWPHIASAPIWQAMKRRKAAKSELRSLSGVRRNSWSRHNSADYISCLFAS